jgi:steroid delta-isomerase-like uncharacterized protein
MSTTQNQTVLQQAIQDWNSGNLAAYLELYDANVALHGFPPNLPPGREGAKVFYDMIWSAFPQPHLTLDDVLIEDDKIACRFTMQATHKGDFMGIPAMGKGITLSGITILRFAGGKCVERWNQADMLGLMQQLGAVPAPS